MIPFNKPVVTDSGLDYIQTALLSSKLSGDGPFTKKCSNWIEETLTSEKALLTTSCTHALEMTAMLLGIGNGDEVIMPSFTFVSTANAFAIRGAKIVFVDIRPDTMNIDERLIEAAISNKTKAIVPVHYAGVACEMDSISQLAQQYNLFVIEDAAQALMSRYKDRFLGAIGDFGCFSFHETKNFQCGEGGALVINRPEHVNRAEIIREKGTNRSQFFRGEIDKYTWFDIGSSYLPSEINAALLFSQFEHSAEIFANRLATWNTYYRELKHLENSGFIELPQIPSYCTHNAHIFYIKVRNLEVREHLLDYLLANNIHAVFHYVPLHSSLAGKQYSVFNGSDNYTTKESERLLRLPLYYNMSQKDIYYVIDQLNTYFKQ